MVPERLLSAATATVCAVYVGVLFLPWVSDDQLARDAEWQGWASLPGAASGVASLALIAWEMPRLLGDDRLPNVTTARLCVLAATLAIATVIEFRVGNVPVFGGADARVGWWAGLAMATVLAGLAAIQLFRHRRFANRS